MTTLSTLRSPAAHVAYQAAHTKLSHHLRVYHSALAGYGDLEDLDEYLVRTVSPAFGATIFPHAFEDALAAYGELQDVLDGNHEELRRNRSGTENNTLELLCDKQDLLDMRIREVLNTIGIW